MTPAMSRSAGARPAHGQRGDDLNPRHLIGRGEILDQLENWDAA